MEGVLLDLYWFLLGALGVWRLTHLLSIEVGPWDVFLKFRNWIGVGFLGKLTGCFYCLSLWVAIPFALSIGRDWKEQLLLWFALSGAAILLERIGNNDAEPATYAEE